MKRSCSRKFIRSYKVNLKIVESNKKKSSEANVDKMLRLKCQMTTTQTEH